MIGQKLEQIPENNRQLMRCAGLTLLVLAFLASGLQTFSAHAQNKDEFVVGDIEAGTSRKAPVFITLPDMKKMQGVTKAWIRVLGLPSKLRFSRGSEITGIWIIPLRDIQELLIISPEGYKKKFTLDFSLMIEKRRVVTAFSKVEVHVTFQGEAASEAEVSKVQQKLTFKNSNISTAKSVQKVKAAGVKSVEDADEEEIFDDSRSLSESEEKVLLDRAAELLLLGAYAPARLMYEELANMGSAQAALELARTYDPKVVRQLPVSGMLPDAALAKKWYKREKLMRKRKRKK